MRKSHPEEKGSKDVSLPPQVLVTLAQRVTRCSVGAVQHPGFRELGATAETLLAQGGFSECPHPTTATTASYHCRLTLWRLLTCMKMEKPACSCATTVSQGSICSYANSPFFSVVEWDLPLDDLMNSCWVHQGSSKIHIPTCTTDCAQTSQWHAATVPCFQGMG